MQITDFGTTSTGAAVQAVTIAAGDLSAKILTLGCTLQSMSLNGIPYSLTLGSDLVSDYEGTMRYFGAIVGPVANRITKAETVAERRATAVCRQ